MLGVTAIFLFLFIFSIVMLSMAIRARRKQQKAVLADMPASEKPSAPAEQDMATEAE